MHEITFEEERAFHRTLVAQLNEKELQQCKKELEQATLVKKTFIYRFSFTIIHPIQALHKLWRFVYQMICESKI